MDYASTVATAPGGWRRFELADLDRLPAAARKRALDAIPAEELQRAEAGDDDARERVRRGLFWTFVYHLAPESWDALAQAEPIHPSILDALPRARWAVDVGAGSGRLTAHLAGRCERVVAVEPALGLARLLRRHVPAALTVAAWAEALPLSGEWSDLTVACAAFGPDPGILDEMRRVTRRGGTMAFISPEEPERFEALGWQRVSAPAAPAPPHEAWIDEFFGGPHPPHEMVRLTRR